MRHVVFEWHNCVALFDEIHSPMEYIKKQLKSWDIYDEDYNRQLDNCQCVNDLIILIDHYNIDCILLVVDKINPEV